MSDGSDPRWDDPRDRDDQSRNVEVYSSWDVGQRPTVNRKTTPAMMMGALERAITTRERGHDPRDVFLDALNGGGT